MPISDQTWTQIWQTALIAVISIAAWLIGRWLIRRWAERIQRHLESTGDLVNRARAQRIATVGRLSSAVLLIIVVVRVPIAFAMGLVGFFGFAYLQGLGFDNLMDFGFVGLGQETMMAVVDERRMVVDELDQMAWTCWSN